MGPWDGMDNLRHFWTALNMLVCNLLFSLCTPTKPLSLCVFVSYFVGLSMLILSHILTTLSRK